MNLKFWPVLRKVLVVIVGFPLVALGLIMIPLPGPGLPIYVAGLFVLALEFEWARKHLRYARAKLRDVLGTVGGFRNSKFSHGVKGKLRTWRDSCFPSRSH